MAYDIIIGRDDLDKKKFGDKATILIGKHYVTMGETTSLSNKVLLDVARPHVILVTGKRGSGKSTSLSVIAEELANLDEDIKKNLAFLFFDTMGIFWTMKYPNERDEELLKQWNLESKGFNVNLFTPIGLYNEYKKKGLPIDYSFSIKTNELNSDDWCKVFEVNLIDPLGILIERVLDNLKDKNYSIDDILKEIKKDKKSDKKTKDSAENRFRAASKWGLFDEKGSEIKDLIKAGEISILDISAYTNWSVKGLAIALISRKLLRERIGIRKKEELSKIKESSIFDEEKQDLPLVWILLDEGHEFMPKDKETIASNDLIMLLREGRQPGISLVLATQQPGEIAKDVITQADIVISHRLTAKVDIEALNSVMQTYLIQDIQKYLNQLPDLKGAAIVLDDNSERIYPIQIRPKLSWHGGESPSAIKIKKKLLDLKL